MIGTLHTLVLLGMMIAITISGWIITIRVRRRMRKALGKKASDLELASLKTWMQVEETEERKRQSSPINPR